MENAYCSHCKKIVFVEPAIDDDELITTGYRCTECGRLVWGDKTE